MTSLEDFLLDRTYAKEDLEPSFVSPTDDEVSWRLITIKVILWIVLQTLSRAGNTNQHSLSLII